MTRACLIAAVLFSFFAASCTTVQDVRGNRIDLEALSQLKIHQSRKSDVLQAFGSPTTVPPFSNKTWIYIGQLNEAKAFLRPEITEQLTVKMTFDQDDVLTAVTLRDQDDSINVEVSEDKTPTSGNEFTVLEQLLGNIGRFNSEQVTGDQQTGPTRR